MKREISVWDLLVWTYYQQSTRHMIQGQKSDRLGLGEISMTQKAIGTARQGVNIQETKCRVGHKICDDAFLIDNMVCGVCDRYPKYKDLVFSLMRNLVYAAETNRFPPSSLKRIPLKVERVWKNENKLKPMMVRNHHGHGIACRIMYSGHTDDQYEKELDYVRNFYSWHYFGLQLLLTELNEINLSSFIVCGLGVEEYSWLNDNQKELQAA